MSTFLLLNKCLFNFQSEQIVTRATLIIVLWFKHIFIRKKVLLYFKSNSAICKRRFLYQTPPVPFSILVYIYNTIYRSLYIDCHYTLTYQSNLHTTHVHYVLLGLQSKLRIFILGSFTLESNGLFLQYLGALKYLAVLGNVVCFNII